MRGKHITLGVRLLRKWDEKRFIAKVIGKQIFSLLYQKRDRKDGAQWMNT